MIRAKMVNLIAGLVVLLVVCAGSAFAWRDGYYTGGKVQAIPASDKLTVGNRTYTVIPKCDIVIQSKNGPSINEKPARFYDLVTGDYVSIKVEGSSVKRLVIERWRQ